MLHLEKQFNIKPFSKKARITFPFFRNTQNRKKKLDEFFTRITHW